MLRRNIFNGDGYATLFANIIYKHLKTRNWFSNADVMAEFLGLSSPKELPCSISKCDHVKELIKAFIDIREAVGERNFEFKGNNRNKQYRYIGADDDPLAYMLNARLIKDFKKYWLFCQDSAGFFPSSWLEYFFKGSQVLLDIKATKKKGEQVLSSSLDRQLNNIDMLPFLYEAIKKHRVLSIEYHPYNMEAMRLLFHPHLLKEHNGRWFLFGHAEEKEPEFGFNLALDRIVKMPHEVQECKWEPAPKNFYTNYFKDIVGVSHLSDYSSSVEEICIRAHELHIFKLVETKPIHHSQIVTIPFGKHSDGEYGDFSVRLEVNNEFIGAILQKSDGLEVVSPSHIRNIFKSIIKNTSDLYDEKP